MSNLDACSSPMVRLCEQVLAARLWTKQRCLSNDARCAAKGLEGPKGKEWLDPLHFGLSGPQDLSGGKYRSRPVARCVVPMPGGWPERPVVSRGVDG